MHATKTKHEVKTIIKKIEKRLAASGSQMASLKVAGHKLDDEWLYVLVIPAKSDVRASDHASLMSEIERELRKDDIENVLLVPALDDD